MAVDIRVPAVGESVVEAGVGRWLKKEGDPVLVGDPVVELETDKASLQVTADAAGVLEKILAAEGATVKPGDLLGSIGAGNGATPPPPATTAAPAALEAQAASSAATTVEAPAAAEAEVRASPLAQRVADELGVDVARVPPTGPGHRVTRDDVEAFAQQARPAVVAPSTPPGFPAQWDPKLGIHVT